MTRTIQSVIKEALAEFAKGPGNDVRLWPGDEAQAYRDNGGFQAGADAAIAIRLSKASAQVAEALQSAGLVIDPAVPDSRERP